MRLLVEWIKSLFSGSIIDKEETVTVVQVETPYFWNPDSVKRFQDELQRTLGQVAVGLPNQCLNVAFFYIEQVHQIFQKNFPEIRDVTPLVQIGNVFIANWEHPYFDDEEARSFADNPLADPTVFKQYHAWITIGELLIDLTLLYSLAGLIVGLRERQVIVAAAEVTGSYGENLRFQSYRALTKAELSALIGL